MDVSSLTSAQRARLRGLGQRLEAALKIGREGLTPAVLREMDQLLQADELVKVRFTNADRDARGPLCDQLAADLKCECVGTVGHTGLFYRRHPDPAERSIELP
jgi:RNA-binding protein